MPAFIIEGRPDLRRHFYRLLGIRATDRSLEEYDSETQETVHYFIQQGLWNAQSWLITEGRAALWRTRWVPTTWVTDSFGLTYAELPDDFLRLDGDYYRSAVRDVTNNRPYGQLIDAQRGENLTGDYYWIQNGRVYRARDHRWPSGAALTYFARHAVLEDDSTALDFPRELRPLIAAEAAQLATAESWMPMDDMETLSRIGLNLKHWRDKAVSDLRPTREPPRFDARSRRLSPTFFGV